MDACRVPTRQMLTGVYFIDAQSGWAVGHDAQILVSHDGGASWTLQFEDREREAPLLDVWFADARRGFAVGAYGALLRSDDGGAHWEDIGGELDNEDGYHFNAIAEAPGAGLAEYNGKLRFDGTPLRDVIVDLQRYRQAPVRLSEVALGGLRVSGEFDSTAVESLIDLLPAILPVRTLRSGDGSVLFMAR